MDHTDFVASVATVFEYLNRVSGIAKQDGFCLHR